MKLYTDGYTRLKNPSPVGGGFTVVDEGNNLLINEEIKKKGFTNNEAEILGILWAFRNCKMGDTVSSDSLVAIGWSKKGKTKSRPDLFPVLQKCMKLKNGKNINLIWEGREYNLAGIYNEFVLKV